MAGFNPINAQERVDSADQDWIDRAPADGRYQADATKTPYISSTVAGWRAQGSEPSSSRGPLAAHMAAEDVNYMTENDLCGGSHDPYLQGHQYNCDAGHDFLMAKQDFDDNHEMLTVPPLAYDRATTRLTYCAGDHAFNGLDNALLDNTMSSLHQSHLRGHEGLEQSNDGAADQHFSTGQQFSTGYDTSQGFLGSFQFAQDMNDSPADQDQYGVAEDYFKCSSENASEGYTPDQDDEEVPSLVQQARDEGLCQDYLTHDPMRPCGLPTPPLAQIDDIVDPYLTAAIDTFNNPRMLERWEVDKESASFLAHLAALGKDDGDPVLPLEEAYQDFSDLRVVEPLLQRDPEQELQGLKLKNAVTISKGGIQPFSLDVEKDEAMDWPTAAAGLPSQKNTDARNEKLEVVRDVILYLKEIMDLPALDQQEAFNILLEEGKPHHAPRAMTPPLLPLSPPWSPPRLPASMHQMPLTSSPEDLIARDLAEVDQTIRQRDENLDVAPHGGMKDLGQGTIDPKLLYSGLDSLEHASSPKELTPRLPQLGVEVPLLPQSSTGSELWQPPTTQSNALALPHGVQSLISDPDADLSIFDPDLAEKDLQAYVNDELMPMVEAINDSVRNESLEEFDTTIRVPVPTAPANEPTAPWKMYTRSGDSGLEFEAQRALMGYTKRELLKDETHWGGVSKLERSFHWSPFPARLGKVNLVEEIDDDKSASRYMADLELEGEVDITSLVTKVDGLRLLDPSDSDDEELEPAASDDEECQDSFTQPQHNYETEQVVARGDGKQDPKPVPLIHAPSNAAPLLAATRPSKDTAQVQLPLPVQTHDNSLPQPQESDRPSMSTLLLKRKLELEQNSQQGAVTSGAADRHEAKRKQFKPSRVSDLLELGGLAGFMGLQGMQADKPILSIHHQPQPIEPPAPAAIMVAPAVSAPPPIFREPLPGPVIAKPTRQMQIVICTQIISDRALVRGLETMLPNLDMVERDAISAAHGDKHTKAIAITEADISLSPAAGLVVTTLQKLKQRRLPGQTAFFGVRERISMVAPRYEKLTVLVSEGSQLDDEGQSPANSLDSRDCDALADFMAFTSTLLSDVEVRYVPGGETELIRWIAAVISECTTSDNLKLLPDETLWERFLRTAGMNAFAAQAVLSQLKGPDLEGGSETPSMPSHSAKGADSGLAAFVRSTAEARVHGFSQMLGGDRVLSRVAGAIDGPWTNAGGRRREV